jgi:hypothetical protein
VGIGFSVRNTGRFPLTIESVESFGTQSDIMLAEMRPMLPPEGEVFAPDGTRPFESIVVEPGEETTIQLMGEMRECEAVRDHWLAGGATRVDIVRLKVRWLLMSTDIEIPLQRALRIEAPNNRLCT